MRTTPDTPTTEPSGERWLCRALVFVVVLVWALVVPASYFMGRLLALSRLVTARVLVADRRIHAGTKIKAPERFFVVKVFPRGSEPKGALTRFDEVRDRAVNKMLNAGRPVTENDLFTSEEASMCTRGPTGLRAVTFRAGLEHGIADWLMPYYGIADGLVPNSWVDVTCHSVEKNGFASRTFLHNVLLLSVNPQDAKRGEGAVETVVLVSSDDEERLTLAASIGKLSVRLAGSDK
jgi:Flp pilus assembly protein CpaB